MHVDEITVEVRSVVFGRLGQIDLRLITDLTLVKRYNNVGAWSLSLPAENDMARELAKPGRGLVVEGPAFTLLSGPVISISKTQSSLDTMGTYSYIGVDDNIYLDDPLAFPQPSNSNVATQTASHDVRTGPAETVMKGFVNANIGPGAPAERRKVGLAIETDQQRGSIVTGRSRFDKLGLLLSDIGAAGVGGLGFDVAQLGTGLIFRTYLPADKSRLVRMDVINDTLDEVKNSISAPTATRAIGAGQGEGVDRAFVMVTDAEAIAAETQWGRRIEQLYDRRDTEDTAEILQEGSEIITSGGRSIMSMSVKPSDNDTMVYGKDWYLGDIVGVAVDDQDLSAIVTEAIIAIDASGVRVAATVGEPTAFNYESQMIASQKDHETRLAFLEKNAESSVGPYEISRIPELPWTKMSPDTIPESSLPSRILSDVKALTTEDLNTILESGWYVQPSTVNATAVRNYPTLRAGYLDVRFSTVSVDYGMQIYTDYSATADSSTYQPKRWIRSFYGGSWHPWRPIDSELGMPPMFVGNGDAGVVIGSTGWSNVAGTLSYSLPAFGRDLVVDMDFGALGVTSSGYWMIGVDVRSSDGTWSLLPETPDPSTGTTGAFYGLYAPFSQSTQQVQLSGTKRVVIPSGKTSVFRLQARKSVSTATASMNYSNMQIRPVRWM